LPLVKPITDLTLH